MHFLFLPIWFGFHWHFLLPMQCRFLGKWHIHLAVAILMQDPNQNICYIKPTTFIPCICPDSLTAITCKLWVHTRWIQQYILTPWLNNVFLQMLHFSSPCPLTYLFWHKWQQLFNTNILQFWGKLVWISKQFGKLLKKHITTCTYIWWRSKWWCRPWRPFQNDTDFIDSLCQTFSTLTQGMFDNEASKFQDIQYCAKVMQMNFNEIPAFLKKFHLKRYFDEISPHFCDTYCFDLCDFSNDNSLCLMIHPNFWAIIYSSRKVAAIFQTIIRPSRKFNLLFINRPRAFFETQFPDWNT